MRGWKSRIAAFIFRDGGASATEYAIMLALIVLISLGAITVMGLRATYAFNLLRNSMPTGL